MKNILLSLILLLCYATVGKSQCREYRVLNQFQGTTISEAKLTICGNEVLYERIQKTEKKKVGPVTTYLYFENVRHYYNNATQEHIVQRVLPDGTKLLSRFASEQQNWRFSEEEARNINGIACQKAILSSRYDEAPIIVWYAPEIPISFGPHSFHAATKFLYGLPGLIMGVSYEDVRSFEILLADEKAIPEQTLRPEWDGIEVPYTLIEKSNPSKAEIKKYMKATK
jgi:GLPGLI family protein